MGISCVSRRLYESNWTLYSSITCISKKKYETRTDEWHTACINPRVPFLGVDKERVFSQWFLHFIKHTKPTKENLLILVLEGLSSKAMNLQIIITVRENHVDIIFIQPHNSQNMQPLD
jgi:hypothetical protein